MAAQVTCVVLGAGEYPDPHPRLPRHHLLIAADGGLDHARAAELRPDVVIGDFDSAAGPIPSASDAEPAETIALPAQKDDTDMLSALKIGWERGMRTFHIYGGLGGRPDHSLANIQLTALLSRHGGIGFLHGDGTVVTAITDGSLRFPGHPCPEPSVISVLCHSNSATGVTEKGLAYRLDDATMSNTIPNGVSNEFVDGVPSYVAVLDGTLVVTFPEGTPIPHAVTSHQSSGGLGAIDRVVSAAVNDGPRSTAAHPVVLYCHRPCSTCDKARAWLDDNAIAYREIEIALHNPDAERLGMWLDLSGLPIRRLFNTSGRLYRSRNISSRLDGMSRDEALAVLASDGMMVRRPVLEYADGVLVGFKPKEWRDALLSYRRGIRV